MNLPGIAGLVLLDRLRQARSDTPVIFVTGSTALPWRCVRCAKARPTSCKSR